LKATVDADEFVRLPGLQAIDAIIVERWNLAVLLRAEPLEPGLAGMNPKRVAAGCEQAFGERIERGLRILPVDANAAFDRNGTLTTPFMVATSGAG